MWAFGPTATRNAFAASLIHRFTASLSTASRLLFLGLLLQPVVPLLARDGEALQARLEVFPLFADFVGFAGVDLIIRVVGFGHRLQQFAKLAHHAARLVEDAFV